MTAGEPQWNSVLAPIITSVLYQPDGKPPAGWSLGQDLRICKQALAKGWASPANLEASIRGLRALYPNGLQGSQKLTLKLLVADKDGSLWRRSQTAHWDSFKRKPASTAIRDILRKMAS